MRVALLTNILTPYRLPVYRELAATPGWKLRFFLSARSEFDRAVEFADVRDGVDKLDTEIVSGWSFRRRSLGRTGAEERAATFHVPFGLLPALRRFSPDVVVSTELGPRTSLAALYAQFAGVPLVGWSYHSRAGAAQAGALRQTLRRLLLSRTRSVVGMGRQAREVLTALGVPSSGIFDAPNAHDAAAYERVRSAWDPTAGPAALRAAYGARRRIALCVGRLVPSKGVRELLAAWSSLPDALAQDWTLLFLGGGALEEEVRAFAADAAPGAVVLIPAVRASQVPDFYLGSDLLVFPTRADPWGLVVNEAFACGLPVLCSSRAGCADDLIRPGQNGWLFDSEDPAGFSQALEEALASDELARLGERGRDLVGRFTPTVMADGLRRAVAWATGAP